MGYDPRAKTVRTTLCLNAQTVRKWDEQDREMRKTGKAQCDTPVYTAAGNTMTMTLKCTLPVALRMHTIYRFNGARLFLRERSGSSARSGCETRAATRPR